MPDSIGPIAVPEQAASGVFPLEVDFPFAQQLAPVVYVHQFASANAKIEQRFYAGNGARRWTIQKELTLSDRAALLTFWDAREGSYQPFTFNAPDEDGAGGTTPVTVRFADSSITLEQVTNAIATVGLVLVEEVTSTPSYSVSQTLTRQPDATMQTALLGQANTLIPLVRLRVLDGDVADIFLSDRRVTVGGNTYLPRILSWSGISQSIKGGSDQAQFTLGNADRVMTELANTVDLARARVEFSVYHLETTTKLDLWAGNVTDYDHDEGDQFSLAASDGLYELNVLYPKRKISRQCWKKYKDGINCTAASGLTTCNKGWDDCVARANTDQFGGLVIQPQTVRLSDNGIFSRNIITASSIVEESGYGQVLKEIFTDSDFPVPCLIAAGRDESEFYSALGVVGEGPIGAYGSGHLLDNQPNHGPGSLGLRLSLGAAPSNPDLFNLDETGGTPTAYRAAGTAFLQIRRVDEKGLQLSRPSEHTMSAVVRQGRTGWVWSGPGSRSSALLTNPIWIAVNVVLRALNLENASAAVQEQYFDVAAAVAAASVCDLSVTPLFGAGSVTQFKFQGFLGDEKPVRDWLQEILNNCVGYYTFTFGKLKLGIRLHSGSLEGGAYGVGNIKMGTLRLSRKSPQFNHLTASYADKEQKFAANSVAFYDEDHIAEYQQESKSTLNLVGTSTRDQAARILSARLREEMGGSTASEWRKARLISFQTTVLGLATEPGQVCSLTHPDMPDGTGEFRLTGWRLNPDWSIDYGGETTTDAMYEYLVGPKPGDILADPPPGEEVPLPLIGCWHPNYEAPGGSDPIFDSTRKRFRITQSYQALADDVTECVLTADGYLPVNKFVTDTRPALAQISTSGSGGSLKADTDYYLQVCAYDADGKLSAPSLAVRMTTPAGGDTCKITVATASWPQGTWSGYKVYLSDNANLIGLQATVAGTLPASFDVTAHPNTAGEGIPIAGKRARVKLKAKKIKHSGVVGTNLAAVGTGYFDLGAGIITADDEFNGRVVSVIADNDGRADIWNFTVTDTVLASNRLTVTPDPQALGITAQDTLVVRCKATTYNSLQVGDTKWINGQYPGGLAADEGGALLRIIGGTGKGQVRRVVSNTTTVHTVDRAFDPVPDASSVWIIEEATWTHQAESTAVENDLPNALVKLDLKVPNYQYESLLVMGTLVTDNAESAEIDSPWREIYIYGQDALVDGGAATVDPVTGVVLTSPLPSGYAANPDYETDWQGGYPLAWVHFTYTPAADPNFKGVEIWYKLSGAPDSDARSGGKIPYVGPGNGVAELGWRRPDDDGTYLFHLASYGENVANSPNFSDSAATEPVAIVGTHTLTAAITGATISAIYENSEEGQFWGVDFQLPTLPTSNPSWSFLNLYIQRQGGLDAVPRKVATWYRGEATPLRLITRHWGIPFEDEPTLSKNFRFTLTLVRLDGVETTQTNPWGLGTSYKELTITRQTGTAGQENAPVIVLDSGNTQLQYQKNQDGVWFMRVYAKWTRPVSKEKYGGVRIWLVPDATAADYSTWTEMGTAEATATEYVSPWMQAPAAGAYTIRFYSVDLRRRENSYQSGVTPIKSVTVVLQAPGIQLSRTAGKLTYQGVQSAFEGVEVMAQSGPFSYQRAAWLGSVVETASTLDLAVTAGNITCRVANISYYIGLEGFFIRIVNGGTSERLKILSINSGTRVITIDYSEAGTSYISNSFPIGSQVYIDYIGGHFLNIWGGGTVGQPSTAPLYADKDGNVILRSTGSKQAAVKIIKDGLTTYVSNEPNTAAPSTARDAVRMANSSNAANYIAMGLSGTSGTRTPYLELVTDFLKLLQILYNDTEGGRIRSSDFVLGVEDFILSGNRDNAAGIPGSPSSGLRSYLKVGSVSLLYKLLHGSRELVLSTGDINGNWVRFRMFGSAVSGASVKSALQPGEGALWWTGTEFRWCMKADDGSGNTPYFVADGTL